MSSADSVGVLVVSEDWGAALRAQELVGRLAERVRPGCELECRHWDFTMLNCFPMRDRAAKEAIAADMIVFSAQWAADLPDPVKSWVVDWSPRKRGSATALVALLDPVAQTLPQPPPFSAFLRETAEQYGMDFFTNGPEVTERRLPTAAGAAADWQANVPVAADADLTYGVSGRGWGINE